ncbi:JAB domain-containing protein [Sporosarcina sp. BP05]|uniref:JAB domain-containing protein n=1 Tax=Sporosarcina sp. BP05 TaxID=2758726 RepID=UPI0021067F60|nr:JAB domain-containing protein [Sporosarcina sp. BP05]
MSKTYEPKVDQLELVMVKEEKKRVPAKRVNIVSLKMIRDSSILYQNRQIRSPQDSYDIIRTFLEDSDRKMFISMALDIKNQPINIQMCHIGSLNASIVHPREVLKMVIMSNVASLVVFHNHRIMFMLDSLKSI